MKDYKRFLSAGCSVPPIEALRYAGVDMEKPDTVKSALQVFADTVEELKSADEILTSSSTAPCVRACRVDGQEAGMRREDLFAAIHRAVFDEYFRI